ncbi:hypothetical protein KY290_022328 [Solanum tuberosum]|uniref:non-specific serine/threonine protein kinase n=1 Tax=Solanum tuberosum TaxID=4113 RepID=A0ABQ7V417_SOLTU|nr:hypothetical protein KY289_022596 [Solanum tuberosum]KAH0758835.1 hypothetical protein KY290_022328 [Solanum tuberosum]
MAKGRKLILITVLPVMGALVLFCDFVVVLVLCDKRRRVRDVERRDDGWLSITMLDGKTLYRDILNATEEFDAKFCIRHGGHGSVYKIDLPSLGNIDVKRLHSSFQNTHPKIFMNEVRALTGIKHQNIVNRYGYCSNPQNSFFVYKYVERGSLSSILSNEVESKKLDWLKKVNIIKGVAFCFVLHALGLFTTDCSRDISSNNVLLDSEYEACVAYFRIAKILKPDSTNRTALAGTYGYVAPDFASTLNSIGKLNASNYGSWSTRMQYYFLGQELWDIIGGSDTTPTTNVGAAKRWKVKARNVMYALTITIEDEFLQRIKNAKTPKEAWDTLAIIITKKNDARLQRLENELLSISQRNMTISQ